ncbi:hypothetical protein Vafri_3501 [Volvox africanus]|uniref:Uncharacterized protein n=1 Tax=Volvox africanus TaxID=51714 RepID=A0A8J4EUT5_9CHLO|nr:hypothetical protein Vafri_3501 [Volvox africanus]
MASSLNDVQGTVSADASASAGTRGGGRSDACLSCLHRTKHVAAVCYLHLCSGLGRLVDFVSNPPVPSAFVPLVHILVLLAALALPWGLSYDAAISRYTKDGPIATLCGLEPLDDDLWYPASNFISDYYYGGMPTSEMQSSPPSFPHPPPFSSSQSAPATSPPPLLSVPSLESMPPYMAKAGRDCQKFKDVFDYSIDSALPDTLNTSSFPDNTIFVAIVIQDVDVKKFVASALINAWFGTTPADSHKAVSSEDESDTRVSFNVLNAGLSLVVTVNSADVISVQTRGINDQVSKTLDSVPVFAERHLRMYPFDKYRFQIRASFSLMDGGNQTYRMPFVVAITQKGAGFHYYIRNPQKRYLMTKQNNTAASEVFFTVWAKRPPITRFVSIFIVLLMWCLSVLIFTNAIYAGLFSEEGEISVDEATFVATVLFALPALRSMQPAIPAEIGLVIDMSGFIWNMTMVAFACIIYLWVIYTRAVSKRRRKWDAKKKGKEEEEKKEEHSPASGGASSNNGAPARKANSVTPSLDEDSGSPGSTPAESRVSKTQPQHAATPGTEPVVGAHQLETSEPELSSTSSTKKAKWSGLHNRGTTSNRNPNPNPNIQQQQTSAGAASQPSPSSATLDTRV